jgi:hypothetical protein
MIIAQKGIPAKDFPFLMTLDHVVLLEQFGPIRYDELIVVERVFLISWLKSLGNKRMLKRVKLNRHEFFLLMLYRDTMTFRMVPLPYVSVSDETELAA